MSFKSLWGAARRGTVNDVAKLIQDGKDVNHPNHTHMVTPLMAAASRGDMGIVQLLVQNGAALNRKSATGRTAFFKAIESYHQDVALFLLTSGATVDATCDGRNVLHWCAKYDLTDMINHIMPHGGAPLIQVKDDDGNTPLHLGAEAGSLEACLLLLTLNASTTVKNDRGKTAKDLANIGGYASLAAKL